MNDENKFSVDEILEAERKAKANGAPECGQGAQTQKIALTRRRVIARK